MAALFIGGALHAQSDWTARDVGNPGVAGSSSVSGSTFTLRGSGADIWGTNDAFHFRAGPVSGDVALVARVSSLENTNSWAKAGLMLREGNGANARNVMILRTPNNTISFQHRSAAGSATQNATGSYGLSPAWLMLSRTGNVVSGYESSDGDNWRMVGSVEIALPAQVEGGLAVTSHNNAVLAAATFDDVDVVGATSPGDGDPEPPPAGEGDGTWSGGDVGNVGVAGTHTINGDGATVTGSGADIWGSADGFRFVHQELEGDGEIIARVASMNGTNGWAKAGVMMRESLAPGAAFAFALLSRSNGAALQFRATSGASAQSGGAAAGGAPRWVRLVRTGDQFSASVSTDGSTWSPLGTQVISLSSRILVGLAVTSHDNASSNTAVFEQIAVTRDGGSGGEAPPVDPTRPAAPTGFQVTGASANSMRLTWTDNATDETSYVIERSTTHGFIVVGSVGPNVTEWTDDGAINPDGNPEGSGLRSGTTYYYTLRCMRDSDESLPVNGNGTTLASSAALWTSTDIGNVGVAGSTTQNGTSVTLHGAGADIWGTADSFRFAYQRLRFNGEIITRVASVTNTHGWAKIGVMFRENLTPGSAYAMLMVTPTSGAAFHARPSAGAQAVSVQQAWGIAAPQWLRLVRTGNTITAYTSTDRVNWAARGSHTIAFSEEIYVGLAVTSHDRATLNTAVFEETTVNSATGT